MKLRQVFLLSTSLFLAQQVNAAISYSDSWFEIEVILINQLGDKSQLKESFPEKVALVKYRKSFDLLANYLYPEISTLKQQLPRCGQASPRQALLEQAAQQAQPAFTIKSLTELEQGQQATEELMVEQQNTIEETAIPLEQETEQAQQQNNADDFYNKNRSTIERNTLTTEKNPKSDAEIALTPLADDIYLPLSETQRSLVKQAEQEFTEKQFPYIDQANNTLQQPLCSLALEELKQSYANDFAKYNSFDVEKIPSLINGIENDDSGENYLLSQDSLKLNEIVKQLKQSKNFKPLLHLGWRQFTRTKNLAIPMKIYAGDNLQLKYERLQRLYQQQLAQAISEETFLNESLFNSEINILFSENEPVLSKEQAQQLALQQTITARLQRIYTDIEHVPNDTETLLSQLQQNAAEREQLNLPQANNLVMDAPQPPIQPWTLDGYLKVEVDHYLHITADLNILAQSISPQKKPLLISDKKSLSGASDDDVKIINFKQDRRVISGQIHYFDHPYVGMIVQIRPYKKPIPIDEELLTEQLTEQ